MNAISTMVGLSIMGAAAPMLMEMSLAPAIAQKKAQNFALAESTAAIYVASNVSAISNAEVANAPEDCNLNRDNTPAYEISCTIGENKFEQSISRSFIIELPNSNSSGSYQYDRPGWIGDTMCPIGDPWGVNHTNQSNANNDEPACKPHVIWSEPNYTASNPAAWLYDVDNFNGWGYRRSMLK